MSEFPSLPGFGVNPDLVTVAGMSAGSYAAMQMHIAYSDIIKGAGLWVGGPIGSWSLFKEEHEENKTITEVPQADSSQWLIESEQKLTKLVLDHANDGNITDLSNLKGSPVYIWGAQQANLIPENQKLQDKIYESFGAKVERETDSNFHKLIKQGPKPESFQHIYGNLAGSGITKKDRVKPMDENWRQNGVLAKFNQEDLIEKSLKEYSETANADTTNRVTFWEKQDQESTFHKIQKWGYIYYPNACVEDGALCKFQMVIHGCVGLNRDSFIDVIVPWASSNNIVMAFPQADLCWDFMDYTGKQYITKNGIHNIFFKNLISQVSQPLDKASIGGLTNEIEEVIEKEVKGEKVREYLKEWNEANAQAAREAQEGAGEDGPAFEEVGGEEDNLSESIPDMGDDQPAQEENTQEAAHEEL